jgi:hypothetical protein
LPRLRSAGRTGSLADTVLVHAAIAALTTCVVLPTARPA